MKTVAILQARTSSSRLPNKVLKKILGQAMLVHQIKRVLNSSAIDELVVATSDNEEDQAIEDLCESINVKCFRGSLNDVLDRFYQAAKTSDADTVIRLTGDCPLSDPSLIDELVSFFRRGNYDYASNSLEPTYPDGLDAEVFRFNALEIAWQEAKLTSEREHVTPFIYHNRSRFKIGSKKGVEDYSYMRWTVDEPQDFDLISYIYENLYNQNPFFSWLDVLELRKENPDKFLINSKFARNEGYQKSLEKDKNN